MFAGFAKLVLVLGLTPFLFFKASAQSEVFVDAETLVTALNNDLLAINEDILAGQAAVLAAMAQEKPNTEVVARIREVNEAYDFLIGELQKDIAISKERWEYEEFTMSAESFFGGVALITGGGMLGMAVDAGYANSNEPTQRGRWRAGFRSAAAGTLPAYILVMLTSVIPYLMTDSENISFRVKFRNPEYSLERVAFLERRIRMLQENLRVLDLILESYSTQFAGASP